MLFTTVTKLRAIAAEHALDSREVSRLFSEIDRLRAALGSACSMLEGYDEDRGACAYPGHKEQIAKWRDLVTDADPSLPPSPPERIRGRVKIVSDGAPFNTIVTVDGKPLDVKSVEFKAGVGAPGELDYLHAKIDVYVDELQLDMPPEQVALVTTFACKDCREIVEVEGVRCGRCVALAKARERNEATP